MDRCFDALDRGRRGRRWMGRMVGDTCYAADCGVGEARTGEARRAEEREDRVTALAATRRARLLLVARKSSASHESDHLTVSNGGPATATSITIRFFTDETGAVPPFLQRPDTASPFELVHGEVRVLGFAANFGCAFSFRCRLEWTDDDGPHMDDRPLELPTA